MSQDRDDYMELALLIYLGDRPRADEYWTVGGICLAPAETSGIGWWVTQLVDDGEDYEVVDLIRPAQFGSAVRLGRYLRELDQLGEVIPKQEGVAFH